MIEHTPQFASPDPSELVSETEPDRLQSWAIRAGKEILDQAKNQETYTPERLQKAYSRLKEDMSIKAVGEGNFLPVSTSPLDFEIVTPVYRDKDGNEKSRKNWYFLPDQYLGSIAKGVYPISKIKSEDKPMFHDALHASEISILQKYCPAISQLMIDAATEALKGSDDIKKYTTQLIDFFTDTFSLDDLSAGMFTWRASDLHVVAYPGMSTDEIDRRSKGLLLEAMSGLKRFMTEHLQAGTNPKSLKNEK